MTAFRQFLHDFAFDIESTESSQYEVVEAPMPDFDETQIVDEPDEVREVVLYLSTKNGRVEGAECTPFVLPRRWTYETLLGCIQDYIRRTNSSEGIVEQLYYKKAKGKTVVKINGDGDIPAMTNEYPFYYRNGKKRSSTMYLAVDLKKEHAPRRSPRITRNTMDIFVHELSKDMKVSSNSDVLHKVSADSTIQEINTLLKTYSNDEKVYTPSKGLYWLRKGSKQIVSLRNEEDLAKCKEEYKQLCIRLACHAIYLKDTEDCSSESNCKRKRKLEFSGSKEDNDMWNDTHVNLVKDLEKRGTLWRYGSQHLKLWTDEIMKGNVGGSNEEPCWENHLSDHLFAPPKSKRPTPLPKSPCKSATPNMNMMEMMMFQQQMLQSTMMTLASNSFNQNPWKIQPPPVYNGRHQQHNQPQKALHELNTDECLQILNSIGLDKYTNSFKSNKVDGPMLDALANPHLGKQLMVSLGVGDENDRHILLSEIYRIKSNGYHSVSSTMSN